MTNNANPHFKSTIVGIKSLSHIQKAPHYTCARQCGKARASIPSFKWWLLLDRWLLDLS